MTFKYENVYLEEVSSVVGPYEKKGPLGKYYDKAHKNFYCGKKTWEQAESHMLVESVDILLYKLNILKNDVDLHISGDLLNQIVATNYASAKIGIPLIGIYSACSTSVLGLILGSNMINANQIKNCLISASSHNNGAEKQFRQPVEYGGPKKKTSTFTTTGAASFFLSNKKSKIKVESATIGKVIDLGVTDSTHMGAVMAPSAAYTINKHLKEMKRKPSYYDLILTGDLGMYGKDILIDYMKEEYNIKLKNHDDAACMIYDLREQNVNAGGSGVACLPLVFNSYIYPKMLKGKINRILLVATGSLHSQSTTNQKLSIPSISHAISLEVNNDLS